MFDMMKMMGKVKEMQARLKEAQDNLDKITATGEAGAGLVNFTLVRSLQDRFAVAQKESLVQPGP